MRARRPRARSLARASSRPSEIRIGGYARLDHSRTRRVGIPEVILAEGKSAAHLAGILWGLQRRGHGALVSRPTLAQRRRLRRESRRGLRLRAIAGGRVFRLAGPLGVDRADAAVALVAAGTSDVPLAEEARAILVELGVRCVTAYDVGVAGLHRLLRALRVLERRSPAAYIVFAGREGALPTVVAGLVAAPVLGVPVSVGYGRGGRGEAALNAMLQSCAPIAVVNIDAAVPAALWAARVAHPRRGSPKRSSAARRN